MAKRLIKGVDWFGWAWRWANGRVCPLWFYSTMQQPEHPPGDCHVKEGRWVRVKFVEVKPTRKAGGR